jgi:hypothetical protein
MVEPPFWDLRRRRRKRFIATQPPSKYVDSIQAFDVSKHTSYFDDLKHIAHTPDLCIYSWFLVNNIFICLVLFFLSSVRIRILYVCNKFVTSAEFVTFSLFQWTFSMLWCNFRSYFISLQDFGVVVMSDLTVETRPCNTMTGKCMNLMSILCM